MGRIAQITATFGTTLTTILPNQRGTLIGWVPVCLAIGIGVYFSALSEPSLMVFAGVFR